MAKHSIHKGKAKTTGNQRQVVSKVGQKRASKKISHLRKEGVPPKQAVAMALNMERAGRLGEKGGYKRKGH